MIVILQLVLGRAGTGKTTYIQKILKDKIKSGNKKIIYLVPDQNSFETEKSLLNLLGEKDFQFANVLTFERMTDFIFRKVGGNFSDKLTDGGRSIFMSMAIEKAESELKLYKNTCEDIEMVKMMISMFKEMKVCTVSLENIQEVCEKLEEGTLKQKVHELITIIKNYQDFIDGKFQDPINDLTILFEVLKKTKILEGYTIFADSFNSLNLQRLALLEEIITQSEISFVTFCTDKDESLNKGSNVFSSVNKVLDRLLSDMKRVSVEILKPIILKENFRSQNNDLKFLENNFFSVPKQACESKPNNIFLYNASDVYDECEFIARTIRKEVIENGYRYRDFFVITRNVENYSEKIENTFLKYEIPYFIGSSQKIDDKTLLCAVFSAFEVAISDFESENIFRYLKTGLVGLSIDEISILENYVFLWEITGSRWKEPFDMNPEGFVQVKKSDNDEKLQKIEDIRKRIMQPLIKFKENISGKTGDSIAKAVYELLEDINMPQNIKDFCGELIDAKDLANAEEQSRLWDILMDALNQTSVTLKGVKINPKRYMELLRLVVQSDDISFIPQGLDEVLVGSVEMIKASGCKIAFIMGAVDGEFPDASVQSGVFNSVERQKLINLGIDIYDMFESSYNKEKFLAYTALSAPSEKIYISWPSSSLTGSTKLPSEIIREVKNIFPNIEVRDRHSISEDSWLWSEKAAFEICARDWNKDIELSNKLKSYFLQKDEYKYKIQAINRASEGKKMDFVDRDKAKDFFGDDIKVSASQIEKFYLCRFQYFCQYSLKAKERKRAKFNSLEYGSLLHFILERIFKYYAYDDLQQMENAQIEKIIDDLMEQYVAERLGGWENKSSRFRYLYSRCRQAVIFLVKRLILEFEQSLFRPIDCELNISKAGDIDSLVLDLPDGAKVKIEGRVDRVDVMEIEGKSYIRIVDYKTGSKDFKLSDVLCGINMQMLLYMTAIKKNGNKRYKDVIPAGVLYMPAIKPSVVAEAGENDSDLDKKLSKKLKMNGLILSDTRVVQGMERDSKGIFIPAYIKDGCLKGEESLATLEQMGIIMKYIESMAIEMAESLRAGEISANPIQLERTNACEWCAYKSICGFEEEEKFKSLVSADKSAVIDEMKKKFGDDLSE